MSSKIFFLSDLGQNKLKLYVFKMDFMTNQLKLTVPKKCVFRSWKGSNIWTLIYTLNSLTFSLWTDNLFLCTALHCTTLQYIAIHCNTLQYTAIHCNTLQYTAIHCNTLQYTAIHCNTLQYTEIHWNTLQYTAIHCNTLCRFLSNNAMLHWEWNTSCLLFKIYQNLKKKFPAHRRTLNLLTCSEHCTNI